MMSASTRSLVFVVLVIVSAMAVSLGLNHQTRAVTNCGSGVTCPYIKTFGADVFAGGWFGLNANPAACGANYQNSQYVPSGGGSSPNYGGILTYAKATAGNNPAGGASSQYGAIALGNIDNSTTPGGFYSAGSQAASGSLSVSYLTFGNAVNIPWGGQLEGSSSQGHCIPDYYNSKQVNTTTYPAGTSLDNLASGNYTITAGASPFVIGGSGGPTTLGPGKNIAIFVNGDVDITGDIVYAAHGADNVPKLAIIAQGNIYIESGVNQITGWYIAQPASSGTPASNDGIVWTCYDSTTPSNASYGPWLTANCAKKLIINGAVVAKHVNLRRVNGDVSSASTSEDLLSNALGSSNVSEIINYTPDMVIGGPFFNASSAYNLDGLIALPPVF